MALLAHAPSSAPVHKSESVYMANEFQFDVFLSHS
jgi:hypothetical protein